mmetsp:Transcript_27298/g.90732  ORF Transcript_27298/g.90732 Transcript_27298/m.90732 type:complete len:192 (-) Transcript_27298:1113-1688(-)|eukprot:CAMPEP_0196674872 /NCGR_PEP_ID=MMETSP1090-20130531/3722_1 /TAXON_ID=37098 /ORGANISM="Isochrysis sp, Strain CCMP1244" /LENGTH=191 /DNA_ID=CAMNT_0042012679 /DNA_START=39 /DNA_END=614 /DNA_ORIENTATION=-
MKFTQKRQTFDIVDGVTFAIKSRAVKVTGPRGSLELSFKHMPIDIFFEEGSDERKVVVEKWFTGGKATASIRTCVSHMENAMTGVTKGFEYKMRFVYSHFPINVSITNGAKRVEIRNFLGEKVIRVVDALKDTTVKRSEDVKDEIVLSGNDIDAVSRTCALIQNICAVKNKDIRKFLDGIYVSAKSTVVKD